MPSQGIRGSGVVALWVVAIIGWSIIPYKAWSRYILGFEGLNLGDIVFVILTLPFIVRLVRNRHANPISAWIVVVWIITGLSVLKGVVSGEDVRELMRAVRAVLFWGLVPMMVTVLNTEARLNQWLRGMVVLLAISGFTIVAFSLDQSLIPANDEVGLPRHEVYEGFARSFTLGMWGVFAGVIFCFGAAILKKQSRGLSLMIAVFLVSCLMFTFVRTFFLLIALAVLLFLGRNWRITLRVLALPALLAFLVFQLVGVPDVISNLSGAAGHRVIALAGADLSDVDPTDEEGFGTVIWRLMEIDAGLQNMNSGFDKLFGVLGREYDLGAYESSMPHIGYFAMFYSNGWIGVFAYCGFLFVVTRGLWRNRKVTPNDRLSWVPTASLIAWVCLLLSAFSAPIFFFPYGVLTLALVVGLSEAATHIILRRQQRLHVAQNINRDPEL